MPIIMKEDLRVKKTKRAIEQAFFELVEERGYENVHLVDIASRAEVNRNTIYLHYESKEGIIKDIVERQFKEKTNLLEIDKYLKIKNNRRKIQVMFETIFSIIADQIDVYRTLLTDQNLSGYLTLITRKIIDFAMSSLKDTVKNRTIVSFVVSGIYEVISRYIIYDIGTIEENVKTLTDLTLLNLRYIQFK